MSKVLILDFGSQFTQLITRRVREQNVYSEINNYNYDFQKIKNDPEIKAIILSGGPNSIYDDNGPSINPEIFELGIPVLGICYGLQLMGSILGGKVEASSQREYGRSLLTLQEASGLFKNFNPSKSFNVWMSHGDHLTQLPTGFEIIASTSNCPIAAIGNPDKNLYGLQFHPEVAHSQFGDQMIANFLFEIAGLEPTWTPKSYIQEEIKRIQEMVGDKKVLCGLSGGVDSSVAAVLIHKAIGDQLQCMFVDHGLLRANEREEVEKVFRDNFKINLTVVDASQMFLNRLKGVTDPEQKRKIIGNSFVEVFDLESKKLGKFDFLAQGTLYPDVIESQSINGPSHVIKSHHNVGGLPENMDFKLLEPLRELFKDEVRQIGRELGITEEIIGRHPFPGPGLAIRIIGEVTKEKITTLQKADTIFIDELKNWKLQPENNLEFLVETDQTDKNVTNDDYRECTNAIIYNRQLDKYLVIKNPSHSCSDHDYYFVGGKKDLEENPKDSILREIYKQTGFEETEITKIFYYGKIKQSFHLKDNNDKINGQIKTGHFEKETSSQTKSSTAPATRNRTMFSDIYYIQTESTLEGVENKPGEFSKWVDISVLENNLLDGFKWVLQNCKESHSLYQQVWQAFCVLTEVKSIGVMGDGRTYENALALRAVTATDGMTADWAHLPYKFLALVSNRIINEVKGVNRVVYDISSKPPATIEWE